MNKSFEKNVIKIQRIYRLKKFRNLWYNIFLNNDLNNIENKIFFNFTKILRNKNLLYKIDIFIKNINLLKICEINSKVLLTAFLIKNFDEELLGNKKERVILDNEILNWSKKLCDLLTELTNNTDYNKILKLISFMNSYNYLFCQWKEFDKNRTTQGLIISYHNRKEHLEHINSEDNNEETINFLNEEIETIEKNILVIDKHFDLDYLENNYKLINTQIQKGLEEVMNSISTNFKKSYLDMLISESNNDNYQIILNFILETNTRILDLTPEKYKNSIQNKLNKYNYLELLLLKDWTKEINNYLEFIIDTVIVYSPPEDEKINIEWNKLLSPLFENKFNEGLSCILLEINHKIDQIYNKLSNLI